MKPDNEIPEIGFQSLENLINNICDKSIAIKTKNTNDIEQLNQDFTTFLDLGRRLVQFCINDKVCKLNI
jgi:hypothetical protein